MEKNKDLALFILRLFLGGLFTVAGATKFSTPLEFAQTLARYEMFPEKILTLMGLGIPRLEIVVGVLLLVGLASRASALISSLLCVGFALTVGRALLHGLNIDCGCFSSPSPVSWGHIVLDLGLLSISLVLFKFGPGKWSFDHRVRPQELPLKSLVLFLGLSGVFNIGYLLWNASPQSPVSSSKDLKSLNSSLIEFTPTGIDFGQVYQGENLEQTIDYKNTSSHALSIEHVDASCGCTTANPTKLILQPGEAAQMTVGLATETKQGPTRNEVSLYFQGVEEPQSFSVTADVQPIISLQPMLIEPRPGQPTVVTMASVRPELDFDVIEIQSPTPGIQARVVGKPKAGQVLIEVSTQATLAPPPTPIDTWTLKIQTDLAGLPPFPLYVKP